jgi:hypothetical protein
LNRVFSPLFEPILRKNGLFISKRREILKKLIGLLGLFTALSCYAATISGTVTDGQDPINGASVILMAGFGEDIDTAGTTTSDAQGNYTFADVDPGIYLIYVLQDGYSQGFAFARVQSADEVMTRDIEITQVDATATISGTITDGADETPLSGATVTLHRRMGGGQNSTLVPLDSVTTGDDGTYSFTNLEVELIYAITAEAEGYDGASDNRVDVASGETETVDLSLDIYVPPAGGISGTVTDEATEAAIEGAMVSLRIGGLNSEEIATTTTDAEGGYAFEGLEPSSFRRQYSIRVSLEDYLTATSNNISVDDEVVVRDIALEPVTRGNLYVIVGDAAGEDPLEGATVNVALRYQGQLGEIQVATTDETGTVAYENVITGSYSVTVVLAGYDIETANLTIEEEGDVDTAQILLTESTGETKTLSGMVADEDGNPVENAQVALRLGNRNPITLAAVSGSDGAYSLSGIPTQFDNGRITVIIAGYESFSANANIGENANTYDIELTALVVSIGEAALRSDHKFIFGDGGKFLRIENIQNRGRLTLHTIKGRHLETRLLSSGTEMISLEKLNTGTVLFLRLQDGADIINRKILVP